MFDGELGFPSAWNSSHGVGGMFDDTDVNHYCHVELLILLCFLIRMMSGTGKFLVVPSFQNYKIIIINF